ncbi:MAG: zinc-finger protein [Caulobacteraceae bacterium]|nr:zinc-finger protein [Caulobacteraceae bacterium]
MVKLAKKTNRPVPDTAAGLHIPSLNVPAPPEVIPVVSRRIACDGVGGALGHPRVWLEMGAAGFVECTYCDRRFVLSALHREEHEVTAPGVYTDEAAH